MSSNLQTTLSANPSQHPINVCPNDAAPIRVLCIDDHPLLLEGVTTIIKSQQGMSFVGAASNSHEAMEAFRVLKPDVTLVDLRLPDLNGIDLMIAIRTEFPDARMIVLTRFQGDVEIQRALQAGAYAYLLKSDPPQQILDTIRRVHHGKKCFSPEISAQLAEHLGDEILSKREVEVLCHVAEGTRNRGIGERLFIAEGTVKVHLKHILGKLNAKDRTQAITIAVRRGIIRL